MNWQRYYKFFNDLDAEQADFFATPGKAVKAVSTYNRALKMLKEKKDVQEAVKLLKTVAEDYPMFPEPAHVYGIYLADKGDFENALKYLKRVSLLDITDEMANMLQEQFVVIEREMKMRKENLRRPQRQTKKSFKKKSNSNLHQVLLKVPKYQRSDNLSKFEIQAINQKLGNDNPANLNEEIKREKKISDRRFIITVFSMALIVFLFFYFAVRPAILNRMGQGQMQEQLEWLEKEITNRAEDKEIKQLLDDYLTKFSQK